MSGLCGWLRLAERLGEDASALDRMAAGLRSPGDVPIRRWHGQRSALCVAGPDSETSFHGEPQAAAALVGYPAWRDSELARIAADQTHAAALFTAYRRDGSDCLRHLGGAFSLAVIDETSDKGTLAIDRMGIGRCCHAAIDGGVAFGTTADSVRAFPGIGDAIAPQGIFNYLFFYMIPAPGTVFAAQDKLMAAQFLEVAADRPDPRPRHYWRLSYAPDRGASPRDLAAALRDHLRAAHARALEGEDRARLGTFLSGGLDSSTVTGLVREAVGDGLRAFTIGFDVEGYDETAYAAIAARHFDARHIVYKVTPQDVLDLIPKLNAAYDEPFGNASAVPSYYCARLARDNGIDVLYAGDGGDEIFAGNERYIQPRSLVAYDKAPGAVQWAARAAAFCLPPGLAFGNRVRRFVGRARKPLPDRLFHDYGGNAWKSEAVFDPAFLAHVDTDLPIRVARQSFDRTASVSDVHRLMHMDHQITLADNDLPKVNRMCELAGVRVRYPMLDDDLVAFSGTVPEDILLRDGWLRGFFKDSLRDFLPEQVITKKKQGFGLPTPHWLRAHGPLRDYCLQCVDAFGRRGVFRDRFVDALKSSLTGDPAPDLIGTCWDVMILEQWLQSRNLNL